MGFDARPVVQSYDGPNAVDAIMRWTNLGRKEAEEAVLAAGGSLECKEPPAPAVQDLKEAVDAALAHGGPQKVEGEASARIKEAHRDQTEREARLRDLLSCAYRRIRGLELEHGMGSGLSDALMGCAGPPPAEMWDRARQKPGFAEIDVELERFSDEATARNKRSYQDAPRFYYCAAAADLAGAVEGGGVPGNANHGFTSLTANLGMAAKISSALDGAMLEYDGDSIRDTGKAAPVEYSHRCSIAGGPDGRGMPLAFCFEDETRILA